MTINSSIPPLTDEASLVHFWDELLAHHEHVGRSLWLAFHDDAGAVHSAVTCVEALPLHPDASAIAHLQQIVTCVHEDSGDVAGVLLLLVRGGTNAASIFEESWADALSAALAPALVWPVMVTTPEQTRRVLLHTRLA